MSRALTVLSSIFQRAAIQSLPLRSVRISSRNVGGEHHQTSMLMELTPDGPSSALFHLLTSQGLYDEDSIVVIKDGGAERVLDRGDLTAAAADIETRAIRLEFTHEPSVSRNAIVETLRSETVLGLGRQLAGGSGAAKIPVFFGVSREPLEIIRPSASPVMARDGRPWTHREGVGPHCKFRFLDGNGTLQTKEVHLDSYLDAARRLRAQRYSLKIRSGIELDCLFPPEQFAPGVVPLKDWGEFLDLVYALFDRKADERAQEQIRRIDERIQNVNRRSRLFFGTQDLGRRPQNEMETILLLERLLARCPGALPQGAQIEILDCSPHDIDAICRYRASSATPYTEVAVEFEYSLRNFFQHGHDLRQVKLIVCFTRGGLTFPYNHFGYKFELQPGHALQRLVCLDDGSAADCLVLEDILEVR